MVLLSTAWYDSVAVSVQSVCVQNNVGEHTHKDGWYVHNIWPCVCWWIDFYTTHSPLAEFQTEADFLPLRPSPSRKKDVCIRSRNKRKTKSSRNTWAKKSSMTFVDLFWPGCTFPNCLLGRSSFNNSRVLATSSYLCPRNVWNIGVQSVVHTGMCL